MIIALYCPWEGDERATLSELLAAVLGPVYNLVGCLP